MCGGVWRPIVCVLVCRCVEAGECVCVCFAGQIEVVEIGRASCRERV